MTVSIRQPDRYELKYVLDQRQFQQMFDALDEYMIRDNQGDDYGRYSITSLYYDTIDYKAYWDKIEGHRFRRKVRVRVYGDQTVDSETRVFAEIKQRLNKTLQKKRVLLPYQAAVALCSQGQVPEVELSEAERAVVDEIRYLYYTLQLRPACIVSYHRLAFEGNAYDPGLRVTFDSNLTGRTHDLTLRSQGHGENRFFVSPDLYIMEVKVNYRVPYWLTEMINQTGCSLRRVSKYCAALEQCKILLQGQKFTL